MNTVPSLMLATVILILAACQSSGPSLVQRGTPGEEVDSLCFARQVDGWQPLSRNAIVVEKGVNDYYRLSLSGACDADRAGLTLATNSRSGICLNEGDEVDFAGDFAPSCRIDQINVWHPAPDEAVQ